MADAQPDRNAVLAELYKRYKQGALSPAQNAIMEELTKRGAFPPAEPLEPGLQDVPLFVPIAPEAQQAVLRSPAVLPTMGGIVGGPPGIVGGEMLRQTMMPQRETPPQPTDIPGLTALAQQFGQAIQQPGILPAAATGGALRFAPQAPGLLNAAARTATGATAATGAEVARKSMTGEAITPGGVVNDALLNTAVQGGVEGGTELARTILQHTQGGRMLRSMGARQEMEGLGQDTFAPPPRQMIDDQFNLVRASGKQISPSALQPHLLQLDDKELNILLREIDNIGAGPNYSSGLGRRIGKELHAMMTPGLKASGFDIGELQQLRSQLRIRADHIKDSATKDLLENFKDAVDTAIDSGQTVGGQGAGPIPQLLRDARQNYAKLRSAEDLDALVEKFSPKLPKGQQETFNLAGFRTAIERGETRLAQSVQRSLDATPGARDQVMGFLDTLAQHYDNIPIDMGGGGVIGIARRALAGAMLSPRGQQMLMGFLTQGGGRVTADQLAILGTLVDHEALVSGQVRSSQEAGGKP
jgi:hypothetical protein